MTVLYTISPSLNLVYYAGFGHCSGQEVLASEALSSTDPLRRPGQSILIDVQAAREVRVELADVQGMIAMNQGRVAADQPLEKTALLVGRILHLSLFEGYIAFSEPRLKRHVAAFLSFTKAVRWLDLGQHESEIQAMRSALQARFQTQTDPPERTS